MTTSDVALRMSSVSGLKANPQMAMRRPRRSPSSSVSFRTGTTFCASFTRSTASMTCIV